MNVLLVHNRNAGKGKFRAKDICRLITKAGHRVRIVRKKDPDLERHLVQPFDLIAISGGDGTVTTVAKLLAGKPTPFTILPLGTANNLAHSVGIEGKPGGLIKAWAEGRVRPFDVARVVHPGGSTIILESAGFGLFAEAMCLAMAHSEGGEKLPPRKRFERDFRLLRRMADTLKPVPCRISIDGRRSRAAVLLCEIMNSRQAGSRLVLAPEADPGDGLLDLVLVTAKHRALLKQFLHRDPSDDHPPHLPVHQCRQIIITSRARRVHLADSIERFPARRTWKLVVEVQPGALNLLVPGRAGGTPPTDNVRESEAEGV